MIINGIPYGYCQCGCGQKTSIAKVSRNRSGYVKGQPVRYVRGHNKLAHPLTCASVQDAFWYHFSPGNPADCWEWQGPVNRDGYGLVRHRLANQLAHRISYELHRGEILDGMLVCHTCDNPICVNPNHLFLGTYKDNARDMTQKGRGPVGEKHGRAKLTWDQVRAIRQLYSAGEATCTELGNQFEVTKSCIHLIVIEKTWKER